MKGLEVNTFSKFLQEQVDVGILVRRDIHELTINLLFENSASQLSEEFGVLESVVLAQSFLDRGQNVTELEDLGHFALSVLRLAKGLRINPEAT